MPDAQQSIHQSNSLYITQDSIQRSGDSVVEVNSAASDVAGRAEARADSTATPGPDATPDRIRSREESETVLGSSDAQTTAAAADDGAGSSSAPSPAAHVITYTEVVLGDEWANGADARDEEAAASNPTESAQPSPAADISGSRNDISLPCTIRVLDTADAPAVGVTSVGGLTGMTHFVVRQPNGAVDIGIDTEKLGKLKSAAAAASAVRRESVSSAGGTRSPQQSVIALQGSDHRTYFRRRIVWLTLMILYLAFYIALIPLCVTEHAKDNSPSGSRSWGRTSRDGNWMRDFIFSFTDSIGECVADASISVAVSFVSILGAWLLRPRLLTVALGFQAVLAIISVATVLSPAIILRLLLLTLGFQVRTGVVRWRPASQPPFFRQLWQESLEVCHSFGSACARLPRSCWRRCRRGPASASHTPSGSRRGDVEAPQFDRSSISLQLGDQVHSVSLQRQLVWNRGNAALSRDSPIVQASTRAVITVDSNGRRSVSMVNLGRVSATGSGNQAFR